MDEQDPQAPTEGGSTTPPAAPPPPSEEMPPAAPPSVGGDLPTVPPAGSEWGAPTQPMGEPMPMGEPVKKNNAPLFIGIGVLAIAVIAAVAFFALKKSSSTGALPDSLNGAARNHSTLSQQVETQAKTQMSGVPVDVAVYGTDADPRYIAMVFTGDTSSVPSLSGSLDSIAASVSGQGGTVDTSNAVSETRNGVEYLCLPASQAAFSGTVCAFRGSRVGIVVAFSETDPHATLDVTQELSDAVQ